MPLESGSGAIWGDYRPNLGGAVEPIVHERPGSPIETIQIVLTLRPDGHYYFDNIQFLEAWCVRRGFRLSVWLDRVRAATLDAKCPACGFHEFRRPFRPTAVEGLLECVRCGREFTINQLRSAPPMPREPDCDEPVSVPRQVGHCAPPELEE